MSDEQKCYICKGLLPVSFSMQSDDAWYSTNINFAAAAAASSAMRPVHYKCRPWNPIFVPWPLWPIAAPNTQAADTPPVDTKPSSA